MEQRVSLITLGVSDVSRAQAFYGVRSREKVEALIEQARGATIGLAHNPGWTLHANVTISLE